MYSPRHAMRGVLPILLCLGGAADAAEFFDDFSYVSGPPASPTDPLFQCFGWYVRTGGGSPGPAGCSWRADYVTWADDPLVPGNRIMRLRASTDGTASGTFQSEVDTHADVFYQGTYGARIKYVDAPPGAGQPSVQAFSTYKGLLCDLDYSECDVEYTPLETWSARCGSQPALYLQTWERYCEGPDGIDVLPAEPTPVCGSLAGWHTLTMIVDDGTVRYYMDGLLQASHGGAYYPESAMRLLLLHWFADPLNTGTIADMTMEVDWVYYAKDTVLSQEQVENAVRELRTAGVVRRNTIEAFPDCDSNGIPDSCEPDSDGDGVTDACDDSSVWRVKWDATGANTGLSWTDALTTLQAALAVAGAGDEIWVAAGTYRPAPPGGDRNAVFRLVSGVAVYGGFAGTELKRTQRDHRVNRTVLSGDLNGNDGPSFANVGENSHVVVDASGTDGLTRLDGFTITGAEGNYGGGLFMDGGHLAVSFCAFVGNSATFGAAICMHESTPTISRCYLGNNRASADGGALYINMGSDPRIIACVLENNQAAYAGGAARVLASSPLFTSCVFRGNRAEYGGAVQHYDSTSSLLVNSLFNGNAAGGAGGAIHNTNSSPVVVNCTLTSNTAGGTGGGLLGWAPSMAVVANCILWGNTDSTGNGEQAQVTADTAAVTCSCVQNWTGLTAGRAVSSKDPLFVDADGPDDLPGTEDDNFRLRPASPCIDAGDNTVLPPDTSDLDADGDTAESISLDLAGYRRLEDAVQVVDTGLGAAPLVDLGAYEYATVAPADFDYDRDVDTVDLQHLMSCLLGPAVRQANAACLDADLDGDADVDQDDFGWAQRCFSGEGKPAEPNCAE